jgi:hypothetical protein
VTNPAALPPRILKMKENSAHDKILTIGKCAVIKPIQEPLKPRTNVSFRFLENQLAISLFSFLTLHTAEVEWSE